jgi:2-polyprenyl-6-methoxyphenol hydroxylase-like FAD-dependent oxidoreductase
VDIRGRPVPTVAKTPVLVVGAGPVGTVLALELAHHNVPSIVVERAVAPSRHPKMDYVNGRSMELLRRLQLVDEIRSRGIAADHPANFIWTRGFGEPPISVWQHPSVAASAARFALVNDGSLPVEPYQRVQGSMLEELLRRKAHEHPLVDLRQGWTFTGLRQRPDGVSASVLESSTKTRHTINATYLAACDGGKSTVRQCVDVPIEVSGGSTQHLSVYFKSSDPMLRKHGRAFVTISSRGLTLVSRDEADMWTGSILLPDDEPFTADPVALMNERLGTAFSVDEVLSIAQWEGSLSVATSYRRGAVFLLGDCAHQFYPTGGHGANTGIADAVDLGWKLAACVRGWGGPKLLTSYEAERRPVAMFNAEMCANLLEVWRRFARLAAAGASREHIAGFLAEEVYQLDNAGAHFGYRYTGSPIIWPDDGPAPSWQWRRITPTTWPGGRPPAIRLADGSQLFDHLGTELTLVDLSGRNAGKSMAERANQRGTPVKHLPIDDEAIRACWERDLVLVRPDQHVAWRGHAVPENWDAVLDHVCGR